MATIHNMPDEIIVGFMSYLSLLDRKTCRYVCKRWYELSYTTSLIKDDVLQVSEISALDKVQCQMKHINLRVRRVGIHQCERHFWEKYGSYIKSIEFYVVDAYNPSLLYIFKHCPNLEFLSLSASDDANSPRGISTTKSLPNLPESEVNLPNLLSLDLSHMNDSSTSILKSLTRNTNKLKRLSIEYYYSSLCHDWNPVAELVQRHSNQLKELNFSHSNMNDYVMKSIIEAVGPQLTGLYMKRSHSLTDTSLISVAKKLVNLTEIDISWCRFSSTALIELFTSLTKLKRLAMYKTIDLNEDSMKAMSIINNLVALDLSECTTLTADWLQMGLGNAIRTKIVDLRLNKVLAVNDSVLSSICPILPNLTHLFVNGCNKITSKGLKTICLNNKILRCLSLQDCSKISILQDETFDINSLKGLLHLDLFSCCRVHQESVRNLNLIELQTLDLSDVAVDRSDIEELLKKCPSLQHVYFSFMLKDTLEKTNRPNMLPKFHYGYCRFEPDTIFD